VVLATSVGLLAWGAATDRIWLVAVSSAAFALSALAAAAIVVARVKLGGLARPARRL
jgi:hypothetical protein